jgi:hypothetical protein
MVLPLQPNKLSRPTGSQCMVTGAMVAGHSAALISPDATASSFGTVHWTVLQVRARDTANAKSIGLP